MTTSTQPEAIDNARQAYEERWGRYRVKPSDNVESEQPDESPEATSKRAYEERWGKYRVPKEGATSDQQQEPEQNAALALTKGTGIGIAKGLAKATTGTLGFLSRLGSAHLEETEPEEKYLTKIAQTRKIPETQRYEKYAPTKEEAEHKLERALIPKWLSAKRSGLQGKTEDVLERIIPKVLNDAAFSGGNPLTIGAGIVGEALRIVGEDLGIEGMPKWALAAELATPTGVKKAVQKAYQIAKNVKPAGQIVKATSVIEPLEHALQEASKWKSLGAAKFIKPNLIHWKKALSSKGKLKEGLTIDEAIDTAKAANQLVNKVKIDKNLDLFEKTQLNNMLFKLNEELKGAAYASPGSQEFARLQRAADHAQATLFQNPGTWNRFVEYRKKHPGKGFYTGAVIGLAASLHLIPPGAKKIAAIGSLGSVGALSAKDLAKRVFTDPILFRHYLRAKSAYAAEAFDVVDDELKHILDAVAPEKRDE